MTITNNSDYEKTLEFLIVPKITNFIPGYYFKFLFSQLPQGLKLADLEFNIPNKIDILLRTECFFELLKGDQIF